MFHVRSAVLDDLVRVTEIARQSGAAAQWSLDQYGQMLVSGSSSARVVLVIEEKEETSGMRAVLCGFLVAQEVAGEWEIENLAIDVSARRRGFGLHLLREFLQLVHSRGGKEIFLEVRESNVAARALYKNCTFIEAGRRKSYYHNPAEDALILKFSFLPKC
jgi:ribosomal-protein-alanine N-acetyltransferase